MSKHGGQYGSMKLKNEIRNQKPEAGNSEWWESLTSGEQKLICSLMRMLRGAKRSQLADVARAAAKWERGIGCFIKVRLMSACRTGHQKPCVSITVKPVTSSPSASRNQSGVSPSRD